MQKLDLTTSDLAAENVAMLAARKVALNRELKPLKQHLETLGKPRIS